MLIDHSLSLDSSVMQKPLITQNYYQMYACITFERFEILTQLFLVDHLVWKSVVCVWMKGDGENDFHMEVALVDIIVFIK